MAKTARKRISKAAVGMKVINAKEEIPPKDELEKMARQMITQGLKLRLDSSRRKLPYFKGSRGSDVKMSRKEKLLAMRFARVFVKGFFVIQWSGQSLN